MNFYAEIAVPAAVDTIFTYRVPEEYASAIKVGVRVKIPFGPRTIVGVVIRLTNATAVQKLKSIHSLVDTEPIFNSELLNTLQWISDYYFAPLGEVLKGALPQGLKLEQPKPKVEQGIAINDDEKKLWLEQLHQLGHPARTAKQRLVLDALLNTPKSFLSLTELAELAIVSPAVLKTMKTQGKLTFSTREIIRREILLPSEHEKLSLTIRRNEHQERALNAITEGIASQKFLTYVLFGITGSGKTQVYIEAIRKTLEQGKTAIVLVPEISLTPQAVRRFQLHFGESVTVIHSQMSDGERFDSWRLTLNGTYKVVIGPRSAIFAPLQNLGLIVVDEEHESSYKQYDMTPHYNARDVALVRAKENNAVVVLGSATPSAESFYNAQQNKYVLLSLPERADNAKLPTMQIVDMRKARLEEYEMDKNTREAQTTHRTHSISALLFEHIESRLKKKEGIILLQNRRGFSAFIECTQCGHVETCKNCSVSLTYHSIKLLLRCHYCGYSEKLPLLCPKCGSNRSLYKGIGTQRVEEELKRKFTGATIARMDLDTTKGKGAHEKILTAFGNKEIDILLGTQMVAKGLDFPHVTLVGVISADLQMLLPDFRAAERTFQLLTQVAGRAGRSSLAGEVVIQTYQPEHYCLNFVTKHDIEGFLSVELFHRKGLLYPPYSRMALVEFRGKNETTVKEHSAVFAQMLHSVNGSLFILGPSAAAIEKLQGYFRYHVLLKSSKEKDISGNHLRSALKKAITAYRETPYGKSTQVKMLVDVDPVGMM